MGAEPQVRLELSAIRQIHHGGQHSRNQRGERDLYLHLGVVDAQDMDGATVTHGTGNPFGREVLPMPGVSHTVLLGHQLLHRSPHQLRRGIAQQRCARPVGASNMALTIHLEKWRG